MIDLRQGDCLELLKDIPDGSIDLTVTSPPYDNLRTYNGNNDQWSESVWRDVIAELYRVTSDGGVVVWVVGDATIKGSETGTSFRQALHAIDCGFNLHDTMIYQKNASPRDTRIPRYWQGFEYMFIWSKGKPSTCNFIRIPCQTAGSKKRSYMRKPNGEIRKDRQKIVSTVKKDKPRDNVWKYGTARHQTHPAPFPEKLAYDHIISWSSENDTVLDCFMGSGTTGAEAIKLNRKFIGFELDPDYFRIAQERINQAAEKGGFLMGNLQ